MSENGSPVSPRYIGALAAIAALILAAGIVFRPRHTPDAPVSELERLELQVLASKRDLERRTVFFARLAQRLAPDLERARKEPAQYAHMLPNPGDPIIIIAPGTGGQPNWISASFAGYVEGRCGDQPIQEMSTSVTLAPSLREGAAFDLDGNLAGLIVPCGERQVLVAPETFGALPTRAARSDLLVCCGLRAQASGTGLRVSSVRRDSLGASAGIEPGDQITAVNGEPAESPDQLAKLMATGPIEMTVTRGRSTRTIRIEDLRATAQGVAVVFVKPDTPLAKAGLVPGDTIISIDGKSRLRVADVRRALESETLPPIVIQRGEERMLLETER